jgi:predicted nucleotidyltransferase
VPGVNETPGSIRREEAPHVRKGLGEATRRRRRLASEVASAYAAHPGVRMVTLTGSAATEVADERSDIDIGVHWHDRIDERWLRQPRVRKPATRLAFRSFGDGVAELYEIEGVIGDIIHTRFGAWEEVLAAVFDRHELAPENLFQLEGLLTQIVLYGDEEYETVRVRLAGFPDDFRKQVIEQHLAFPWLVQLVKAAERPDPLLFADLLVEAAKKAVVVLGALNRRYMTTMWPRRSAQTLREMMIVPARAAERLEELLMTTDRGHAVHELEALLRETVALVERHAPEVDVSEARRRLRRRPGGGDPQHVAG